MHPKIHLKKKIHINLKKFRCKFSIVLMLLIFAIFYTFKYINTKVSPLIVDYASVEAKNISTYVMNKAISKNVLDIIDSKELFIISKNSNNEINTVDFNPVIVNKVLTQVTSVIHYQLKKLENGITDDLDEYSNSLIGEKNGILFSVPSGIVFNNALISNIGPKIPVKISFFGDIVSNINTKITNYGINNALIEINLNLKITEKVILPISVKEIEVELNVPIALKLIQGNIPEYYLNGINSSSPILTVPVE